MLDLNQLMKSPILAVPGIEPGSERVRRVHVRLTTTLRATITPHHQRLRKHVYFKILSTAIGNLRGFALGIPAVWHNNNNTDTEYICNSSLHKHSRSRSRAFAFHNDATCRLTSLPLLLLYHVASPTNLTDIANHHGTIETDSGRDRCQH